jgi:hypothetical protein
MHIAGDIARILASLEGLSLAGRIRDSLYLFPFIESLHVLGLTIVFGTIAILDLRLLGIASTGRPVSRISSDVLKCAWAAFVLTVATGLLMFITNADVYYHNVFFRAKMAMLVAAGLNVLAFELTAGRSLQRWDKDSAAPAAGRTAAILSLALWVGIIFMGRWIGFTTTRASSKADTDVNIEELLPK